MAGITASASSLMAIEYPAITFVPKVLTIVIMAIAPRATKVCDKPFGIPIRKLFLNRSMSNTNFSTLSLIISCVLFKYKMVVRKAPV